MAKYTNDDLAKKIDQLPDTLIERLDDRYLKKDDAEKDYLKRRDAGMIGAFIVGASTVLGVLATIAQSIWGLLSNRGN